MKYYLTLLCFAYFYLQSPAQEHYLVVGTYDSPESEGIYIYTFNSSTGNAEKVSHIKSSNPSFVAISPDEKFVYAVFENSKDGNGGEVAAYSFDRQTGQLRFINKELSGGDHPCYVETDKTGKWVFAGNYSSGNLAVFPVNTDGGLSAAISTIQHSGSGKNFQRQKSPHVHSTVISPDNNWLFAPDLGIDKIMIYRFDANSGQLTAGDQAYAVSEPGSGPRHFTFHPNNKYAYLIEELSGTVVTYKYKKGKLNTIQRLSTMPSGDTSFAGSADIHVSPDGKFLYATNRSNANTIAIYSVNKKGKLSLIGHQSTLGKGPRNFNFDPSGSFLLVGNQHSDEIVIFKRDATSGLLSDSGKRIAVGKPVCIKWISAAR
ncbi:MAG TPA: lactonase family protein [Chitinophagaceae bacterium]|nr:lactonase family protein [Chitinophagaceae bacterium]